MPRVPSTVMLKGPPSGRVVSFSILSASTKGLPCDEFTDLTVGNCHQVEFSGHSSPVESPGVVPVGIERSLPAVVIRFRQPDALGDAGAHAFRTLRRPDVA